MMRWITIVAVLLLAACGDEAQVPHGAGGSGIGGEGGGGSGGNTGGSGGDGGGGPLCGSEQIHVGGACRDACDPQSGEREDGTPCATGTCTFLGVEGDAPWGACLPGDTGGGGRGSTCSLDEPCGAAFVCIDQSGGGRCVPVCDPDDGAGAAACGEGLRCDPVGELGACVPRTCLNDADCPTGQTCATWERPDGFVDAACIFAVGEGAAGEGCTGDADCASGECLENLGICYGACRHDADCADGGSCVLYGFEHGAQSVWVPTCLRGCTDDASCGDGQACVYFDDRELDTSTVCVPAVGEGEAGAACTTPEDCRSGRCEVFSPGSTGYCEGGCTDDDDCGEGTACAQTTRDTAGADGVWGTADDWEVYPRCRGEVCTSSEDCGDWACSPTLERVNGTVEVVHRCSPPAGTAGAGDRCMEFCATGACIRPPFAPPEDCFDDVDNDGNGFVDCDDLFCAPWCAREVCDDGVDNDGDGAVDCADLECEATCDREICRNDVDDDGNGLVDCDDPDCVFECHELTACNDYADEDGDGLIDCDDPDCCIIDWEEVCIGKRACGEVLCYDGEDDDRDGATDCADRDCFDRPGCIETDCTNGEDEDGDGLVDCADAWDCGRVCTERSCSGGVDEDLDGLVDCHDDDCANAPNCAEHRCAGGDCCTNGADDDGDGRVDCQDTNCAGTAACTETVCERGNCCADGQDGDGDGLVDCADRDCARTALCNEGMGYDDGSCEDALDQDGDGLIDCADPDCGFTFTCMVCYEPCEDDADCPGGSCVEGAAIEEHPFGGNFRFVKTCTPN